ncbi:hypothetical protein PIB30_097257 [Stylosanthes scabra]|uniref:Uncharacterized protein n=1 Tax=Stylosanthes scabra TaxID=79078 RepID=A0ABU6QYS2_9FABA|nr:hypothetical protein [Stylosanthes scabra]
MPRRTVDSRSSLPKPITSSCWTCIIPHSWICHPFETYNGALKPQSQKRSPLVLELPLTDVSCEQWRRRETVPVRQNQTAQKIDMKQNKLNSGRDDGAVDVRGRRKENGEGDVNGKRMGFDGLQVRRSRKRKKR